MNSKLNRSKYVLVTKWVGPYLPFCVQDEMLTSPIRMQDGYAYLPCMGSGWPCLPPLYGFRLAILTSPVWVQAGHAYLPCMDSGWPCLPPLSGFKMAMLTSPVWVQHGHAYLPCMDAICTCLPPLSGCRIAMAAEPRVSRVFWSGVVGLWPLYWPLWVEPSSSDTYR